MEEYGSADCVPVGTGGGKVYSVGKRPAKRFPPWLQSPDIGYWKKSGIELAVLVKESGELMELMGLGVMPDDPEAWAAVVE